MEDVLIVGAGPAGLTLAIALIQLGIRPLLIDRRGEAANTSRAAVVHARTLEVLRTIGVTDVLLGHGIKVATFRVRDRDRCLLEVDFSNLGTPYPFTLMIPQNVTEQLLINRLEALGGGIERSTELKTVRQDGQSIEAVLVSDTAERCVTARWVVGCDGAHSVVRKQAGIAFAGGSYHETFVLADVRLSWSLSRNEVNLFLSRDGLAVVAPLPGDHYRIVATVDQLAGDVDRALIQRILDERGPTGRAIVDNLSWSSRFHLQHRVTETPWSGQIVLCGDAAHVHSPAGGQGMNTGIQDAISLAGPLSEAVKTGSTGALKQWAVRRHSVAEDVVSLTDRMTRMATVRSGLARSARNLLLTTIGHVPGASERIARRLAELDYE